MYKLCSEAGLTFWTAERVQTGNERIRVAPRLFEIDITKPCQGDLNTVRKYLMELMIKVEGQVGNQRKREYLAGEMRKFIKAERESIKECLPLFDSPLNLSFKHIYEQDEGTLPSDKEILQFIEVMAAAKAKQAALEKTTNKKPRIHEHVSLLLCNASLSSIYWSHHTKSLTLCFVLLKTENEHHTVLDAITKAKVVETFNFFIDMDLTSTRCTYKELVAEIEKCGLVFEEVCKLRIYSTFEERWDSEWRYMLGDISIELIRILCGQCYNPNCQRPGYELDHLIALFTKIKRVSDFVQKGHRYLFASQGSVQVPTW